MARRGSSLFAFALVALPACSSSAASTADGGASTFAADAYTSVTSDSGKLTVEVHTVPGQPPSRGAQSLELVIADAATKTPATGLTLAVVPWMPAMGHGTSVTPSVSEASPGSYVVSDVDFFMAGTWELRTTITGSISDHAAPSFQIQ